MSSQAVRPPGNTNSTPLKGQVSISQQIEAVRRAIETRDFQAECAPIIWREAAAEADTLRAVLVTLQQHERLQDELRGAREDRDIYKDRVKQLDDECQRFMREVVLLRERAEM